jgi:hypothetical protein
MLRRTLLATGLAAAAARPALALDPGRATGRYNGDGADFRVSHAIALEMDNIEGFPDKARGYRVLLSDREVPLPAICGLAFPPVWRMARRGQLSGLLLRVDPADRKSLVATVLTQRDDGYSPPTITMSNTERLWNRLEVGGDRIVGELAPDIDSRMVFEFSAPVFSNPVEADLRGAQALASEPVRVLLARAEALGRRDLAAAAALSTADAAAELAEAPPELLKMAPQLSAQLVRDLRRAQRVVIRRETAAVMLGPDAWASLAKVDGAWKAAN